MTAKEAARISKESGDKQVPDIQEFISGASCAELVEFMQGIRLHADNSYFHWARIALDVRLADEQARSAERLEQQTATLIILTRWLFRLTWILVIFTAGLLVFTYFLVKQEQHTNQTSQHHE